MTILLPTFLFLLLTTTAVLIALFSRRPTTPGLSEVICPIPGDQQ